MLLGNTIVSNDVSLNVFDSITVTEPITLKIILLGISCAIAKLKSSY